MSPFDYFVVFAEMRTGSNFLETNINAYPDLTCHGEAFNPAFPGYPNRQDVLGITMEMREADPAKLIARIRDHSEGLGGFRYFHDHDPRVLDPVLEDPRCAKIVLTRNPVESYVSWKIAKATNQWKLTNVQKRREAKALFEAAEFEAHVSALQTFQVQLMNRLQALGQTAFYIDYEDLQSVEVMNGLAKWLGSAHRLDGLDKTLKVQNPAPLSEKIENFDAVPRALERLDRFNLNRTPNFEPRRGPMVPGYVAATALPLLYMPIRGGPEVQVTDWLAMLGGGGPEALVRDFSQNSLRKWMDRHPGHRAFTVVRHPLARAHHVFCRRILDPGEDGFPIIRRKLRKHFGMDLPEGWPEVPLSRDGHRAAFAAFLRFVRANLAGQTSIRMDGHWASQSVILQGYAEFALPDMILREEEMAAYLPALAMQLGRSDVPEPAEAGPDHPIDLADIHDAELEALAREAWPRDYQLLGFGNWSG